MSVTGGIGYEVAPFIVIDFGMSVITAPDRFPETTVVIAKLGINILSH